MHQKREWLVIGFFLLLAFFIRFPAFFQSAIGPDEGLYLLVAKNFVEGNPPYTVVWDNKPIGIYLFFSLALILFGDSIASIRIIACLAVFITCYLLYRLGKVISNNVIIGLLAGILYAVFSTGIMGLMSDTEIFFAPFITLAFYLLFTLRFNQVSRRNLSLRLLGIGLLIGCALQIKQVVIFQFLALLIILGIDLKLRSEKLKYFSEIFKSYALVIIGAIIPLLLICFYYLINGHFQDYLYANFLANIVRVSDQGFSLSNFVAGFLIQIKSNFILWLCLLLTPFYWISTPKTSAEEKRYLFYLILWFLMALLGVAAPKTFYIYYFLQLLPPLCLISAYLVIKVVWAAREIGLTKRLILLSLIFIGPILNTIYPLFNAGAKSLYFRHVKDVEDWGDDPAIIARYLEGRVSKDDYIFVVDYFSVLYYLLPAKIPTRYPYPRFLLSDNLSKVAGTNPLKELRAIMNKKPLYVIRVNPKGDEGEVVYKELDKYLQKDYVLEKSFPLYGDIFEYIESQTGMYAVELYRLRGNLQAR